MSLNNKKKKKHKNSCIYKLLNKNTSSSKQTNIKCGAFANIYDWQTIATNFPELSHLKAELKLGGKICT